MLSIKLKTKNSLSFSLVNMMLVFTVEDSHGVLDMDEFQAPLDEIILEEMQLLDFPNMGRYADKEEFDVERLERSIKLLNQLLNYIKSL